MEEGVEGGVGVSAEGRDGAEDEFRGAVVGPTKLRTSCVRIVLPTKGLQLYRPALPFRIERPPLFHPSIPRAQPKPPISLSAMASAVSRPRRVTAADLRRTATVRRAYLRVPAPRKKIIELLAEGGSRLRDVEKPVKEYQLSLGNMFAALYNMKEEEEEVVVAANAAPAAHEDGDGDAIPEPQEDGGNVTAAPGPIDDDAPAQA